MSLGASETETIGQVSPKRIPKGRSFIFVYNAKLVVVELVESIDLSNLLVACTLNLALTIPTAFPTTPTSSLDRVLVYSSLAKLS